MGEYIPEQPPERSREPVGMCRVRPLQRQGVSAPDEAMSVRAWRI